MDIIGSLLLPHIVIGILLGIGEWLIAKAFPRFDWVLPVLTLAVWIAMLAVGCHNNPNGKGIIFVFFGCPALIFWGAGLGMGWSYTAKK